MPVKHLRACTFAAAMAVLAGCGNDYDGGYSAVSGFMGPLLVIQVAGSEATVAQVDMIRRRVMHAETWSAETKAEKLLLTNTKGKTYAFVRAVDEKGLECLNCGLGTGLPKSWQPLKKPE